MPSFDISGQDGLSAGNPKSAVSHQIDRLGDTIVAMQPAEAAIALP